MGTKLSSNLKSPARHREEGAFPDDREALRSEAEESNLPHRLPPAMVMSSKNSTYFELTLDSLRALGGWAARCAARALPIFERHAPSDARPRAAIEGIRTFAAGGKRTAELRSLALAALAAAREAEDPAAKAAAQAAGFAASSAYTHPLADVNQTKHIVGPAAYSALAVELEHAGDARFGDTEVRWAMEHMPAEARDILLHMPARPVGKGRVNRLMYELDNGIRKKHQEQKKAG